MSMDKLRHLTARLEAKAENESELLRAAVPLLTEVVHELANVATMVGAIERRLEKLEAAANPAPL